MCKCHGRPLQHLVDTIEGDGLVLYVDIALQNGIDRDQVVHAGHLDAVPGVEHHGDVGIQGRVGKIP